MRKSPPAHTMPVSEDADDVVVDEEETPNAAARRAAISIAVVLMPS